MWENDTLLIEYLRAHPNVGEFSKIYKSTSGNSRYYNGDRFVYMRLNPNAHPPIAPRIKVGNFSYRVHYSSMNLVYERCRKQGHHTHEISKCEAYEAEQPNVHFFSRGILSNFDPCPVTYQGISFLTSEHAYQWSACVEVLRDDLAEEPRSKRHSIHVRTTRLPLDLWTDPAGVMELLARWRNKLASGPKAG